MSIVAVVALALASGCHRRFVEGRRAPAAEPVTVDVGTATTTGADVPREEIRHEAWGPLPPALLSEPLVTAPAPSASAPPAPAPSPSPASSPTQQKEEEPPRRVGPPSAADPNEWGGS